MRMWVHHSPERHLVGLPYIPVLYPLQVLEMDRLDGLGTPLEKLVCMKTTLDVISQTVNGYLLDSQTTAGDGELWTTNR